MKSYLLFFTLLWATLLTAQGTRNGAPHIFLDCQWGCDQQYLKTELTYVNFVRDRADADVFIQQSGLANGSGGAQYSLFFFGQNQFAGKNDTLVFNVPPAASSDDTRQALKTQLERGLLPYLLKSSLADRISFSVEKKEGDSVRVNYDPWNFWTISLRANGYLNGQEVAKSVEMFGNFEANRVTERQKTSLSAGLDYARNTFRFDDTLSEVYENGGYYFSASQVFSINDHWSYGFFGGGRQAQFNNLKMSAFVNPGIEYNVFPYKDVARRQLTFRYQIGSRFNQYFAETIYFKTDQWLGEQSLGASYKQVLQWGSFNLGMHSSTYLHDWRLNETNVFGGLELNLFKGFNFNLFGEYGLVHNQIELPNDGATKEEALLRIRQLQTGYNYFMYFGVSYTFGSIYSNVVNPRFGGADF